MLHLSAAGLSTTEANVYQTLLSKKEWKPAELAKNVRESRTNTYKILDKLVAIGLAEKYEKLNKLHYRATNPTRLLQLAHEQRVARQDSEKLLEADTQRLLGDYIRIHEQPGIRYYQGKQEMQQIFDDMLDTGSDIYLLRSPYDNHFMGKEFYDTFKKKRAKLGIATYIYSADIPSATHNATLDKINKMKRTWLPKDAYDSPVEWNVYGNKIAIISYGLEAFATVVESKEIADSFKKILRLLDRPS
jgi:sugar-specific transcriptional regulator TrmB